MKITGNLFIVSAPSGTGKTSLVSALLKRNLNISLSVSYTTRLPRLNEQNGQDYFFLSRKDFIKMQLNGEFLESAEIYGNLYGTSQKWINEALATGCDTLLEIDCQGAKQVRRFFHQAVGIFILPPSLKALTVRLKARGQDSPEVIERRLLAVAEEVSHIGEFDYIVINRKLEEALADISHIILAQRLRVERQLVKHHALITDL